MAEFDAMIILASTSPRRRSIIAHLGIAIEVIGSHVSEDFDPNQSPEALVTVLALRKADEVAAKNPLAIVIGADTIVVCDGVVLNKPEDLVDAERMLRSLRGQDHEVFTGLAVVEGAKQIRRTSVTQSVVRMRSFSDEELTAYLATGDSLDKAGAYGIQGEVSAIVESVSGCFLNVAGLPMCALKRILSERGMRSSVGAPPCSYGGETLCPVWASGISE